MQEVFETTIGVYDIPPDKQLSSSEGELKASSFAVLVVLVCGKCVMEKSHLFQAVDSVRFATGFD